jgi:site-specific DNA recombinase
MQSAFPQTIRAAIYARVSSERQAQDGTIASQLHALRERVAADGLSLDEELCFIDDGYSGSTVIRPALERLRDQAAGGAVDRLYVLAPDRLARRYAYQVLVVDELQRAGVEMIFLNRPLGQGPEDHLLLQVQGVVAEYERAKILERSRRGRLHAARSGRVSALTKAPYGYRYVSKALAGGSARFEVCLPEAEVVRAMFGWVAEERISISQVAFRLTARGVLSPRGRTYWDRSTVWGMLRNPAYKGLAGFGKRRIGPPLPRLRPPRNGSAQPRRPVSWKRTAPETWTGVPVPAILDEALFEAVQEQLRENQRRSRLGKAGARYLLQGLIVCTACGYAMVGRRCEGRWYYRCVGNVAHRWSRTRVCQSRSVRGEGLEAAVWADVSALLAEPGRIEEEFRRRLSQDGEEDGGPDRRRLEALASRARRQISKLIDAYSDGLIEKGEFEPRIRSAREQLERAQADLRAEQEREAEIHDLRVVIGHLETFADRVRDGLESADWETQRRLISTLVKRIEVGEEEVRMVYRVQCAPFEVTPSGGHSQDCWRRRQPTRAPWRCHTARATR